MPKSRPPRPPAPPRADPELIRLVREAWPIIQWKKAISREINAMCTGKGPWHITSDYYIRAGHNLIEKGILPPPGFPESQY
ncbi:MAG TPA: hypothetical protein VF686_06125 [Brevundimonas sp.]